MEDSPSSSSTGSQVAFLPLRRPRRSPGPSPLGREISSASFSGHRDEDQEASAGPQLNVVRELSSGSSGNGSGSSASRVIPLDAAGNRLERWATLVWRDLTVTDDGRHKVVQGLTGYATPGTLTVFMGSSSSGKSYLLQTLAGRLPRRAKVYGEVLLNGRPRYLRYGTYAYVHRGDALLDTLTVRETLYYAALLQLPLCIPCSEKIAMVDAATATMELEDVANLPVGGPFTVKGLSAGERRRLTIAVEILSKPTLVFCEEPITNLDSVSAFLLIASLKKLTAAGCTVVITAERMCTEVFHLVTTICLLSNGKTVFFGDTSACLEHFANSGFPCPSLQNPTDHFLRALNPEFEKVNRIIKHNQDYEQGDSPWRKLDAAVITKTLETSYNASTDVAAVEAIVSQLGEKEGPVLKSRSRPPFIRRLAAISWRSFLNMFRSYTYYWFRFLLSTLLMFCIATIFYNLDDSPQLIPVRVSGIFCMISFLSLQSIGALPSVVKELKAYQREKQNKHSSSLLFVLSNALSSLPYLFCISAICSAIGYFLMGFHVAFLSFIYFLVTIFLCFAISESLLLLAASITLDIFSSVFLFISIQVLLMLVGGYFRHLDELPKPVWRYPASFIAFQTYATEGLLKNEYTGETGVLSQKYTSWNSWSQGKWMDLLLLAAMLFAHRLLFFLVLLARSRCSKEAMTGRDE